MDSKNKITLKRENKALGIRTFKTEKNRQHFDRNIKENIVKIRGDKTTGNICLMLNTSHLEGVLDAYNLCLAPIFLLGKNVRLCVFVLRTGKCQVGYNNQDIGIYIS